MARSCATARHLRRSHSRLTTRSRSSISWAGADMAGGTAEVLSSTLTDPQPLTIAGREFRSRLMVGTGKYASNAQMIDAIEASGAEVVTVAVRRVDLDRSKDEGILP